MKYLILSNLYLIAFYLFYAFFLRRDTHFHVNRFYLLVSPLLAFTLPLLPLNWLGTIEAGRLYSVQIFQEVQVSAQPNAEEGLLALAWARKAQWLNVLYLSGCLVAAILFIKNLLGLLKRFRNPGEEDAFSFFGFIHVGASIDRQSVREHESVHAREYHSVDLMFFEVLKVVNWFNPIVYLFSKAVRINHEFLADQGALHLSGARATDYATMLLQSNLVKSGVLQSSFFQSPLKARINMLLKERSGGQVLIKYLGVLPLCLLMLLFSRCIKEGTQDTPVTPEVETAVVDFVDVDVPPEFPGGIAHFLRWVGENYRLPEAAIKGDVNGMVHMSFVVQQDGTLKHIKVLKDIGYGTGEEAIRVLRGSPKWTPGKVNGQAVNVSYALPIRINTES